MSKETKTTAPAPEAMTAEEIVAKAQAEAEAIRAAALTAGRGGSRGNPQGCRSRRQGGRSRSHPCRAEARRG